MKTEKEFEYQGTSIGVIMERLPEHGCYLVTGTVDGQRIDRFSEAVDTRGKAYVSMANCLDALESDPEINSAL